MRDGEVPRHDEDDSRGHLVVDFVALEDAALELDVWYFQSSRNVTVTTK